MSSFRPLEQGDKLAFRYSQKGVIGEIADYEQKDATTENTEDIMPPIDVLERTHLPFVCEGRNKGLVPDIIFSPMSLTLRSTPGLIMELQMGNYAVTFGETVDATAFSMNLMRMREINRRLQEAGFPADCFETFQDPQTGKRFKAYIGVCYIRVLEHTFADKLKACSHTDQLD